MTPHQQRKQVGVFKRRMEELRRRAKALEVQLRRSEALQAYVYSNCPGSFDRAGDIVDSIDTFKENF